MNKKVQIREIRIEDFDLIAELTNQLGSEVSTELVKDQVSEILRNPDHFAFVAVKDEKVIGYIHCFKAIRLTSKPFIEICGLVVHEIERGNGIGKLLVKKAEELSLDVDKVRVRCNSKRELAHKFYSDINYIVKKEQKIFEMEI